MFWTAVAIRGLQSPVGVPLSSILSSDLKIDLRVPEAFAVNLRLRWRRRGSAQVNDTPEGWLDGSDMQCRLYPFSQSWIRRTTTNSSLTLPLVSLPWTVLASNTMVKVYLISADLGHSLFSYTLYSLRPLFRAAGRWLSSLILNWPWAIIIITCSLAISKQYRRNFAGWLAYPNGQFSWPFRGKPWSRTLVKTCELIWTKHWRIQHTSFEW